MESNQIAFELDFFLNLADCSTEEKNLLETILKKTPSSGPTGEVAAAVQLSAATPVSAPTQPSNSTAACPPTTTLVATPKYTEASFSIPEVEPNNFVQPQQQQQQQQHHGMQGGNNEMPPMQHQMYEYPTSSGNMGEYASTPQTSAHAYSSYSATATGSPYVFINNVTANVNVHHGPTHLQDDQQLHQQHHLQHQQQQMQIQQQQQQRYQQGQQMHHQGPPPMTTHPGPPPAALLPTPHFVPVVSQAGGYIAPFPNQQQPRMSKANVGQQQTMYPMPPMYHPHFLPFPAYGYVPQMMASIPQVPQPQALPRAQVPLMRAPTSLSQGHMFSPPPPLVGPVTIPLTEMAAFPAPPPSVTSAAPLIVDGSQVQVIDQQQLLQAHHQQVEVTTSLASQQPGPAAEAQLEAETETELIFTNDEDERENFGFVVEENASEVEDDEGTELPAQGEAENISQGDQGANYRDVPTPVQDEPVEVDEVAVKAPESATQQRQEESRTPVAKSWASLFHTENQANAERGYSSKPMALIHPYTGDLGDKMGAGHGKGDLFHSGGMSVTLGRKEAEMAAHLQGYVLNHKAQSLKPRGLSNRSNWCFVNAIMQALVACPPFFNLMKSLPAEIGETIHLLNSPLKILAAVNAFVAEFTALENFPRMNHRRDKNKKPEDLPLGKTFEAATIFQVLLNLNSDTFKVIEGRQEDAEEFLTFLLNGLNDEMLSVLKLVNNNECGSNYSADEENQKVGKIEEEEGADEWQEVGPKNKSCITRRGGDLGGSCSIKTPLADMFQGQIRSCVQRTAGETTATLQPFFTLQLDIQSENIRNVAEALTHNFCVEALDGYVCSRTKQEIEASRSLLLEELPPILVLHLKRFVYNETSGGCQKLLKNIDFPVDLEIPRDILSPNSKNKYASRQRQYKLFAVVYHNGTEATKGHYVADVYHTGLSTWLHCDDSSLKPLSENMVMAHSASSMPYILFYRRGDTMGGGAVSGAGTEKAKSSSSASAAGVSSNKSSSTQMT